MSKLLFFSDIHIAAHKGSQDRLDDCLNVLKWVFTTARSRKIRNVIFGGDLFQDRQKISLLAYNKTFDVLAANDDIGIYLLLGNHDLWFYESTEVSSVHPFSALDHVSVIDEPGRQVIACEGIPDIDFLPFTHNPVKILKEWKKKSKILVAHIAVDGSTLNFHHRTKAEVNVEHENDMVPVSRDLFEGWERVFLGHYHGAQKLTKRAEYLGSPLELSFGEAGCRKHLVILDTETMDVEYVENKFSPKHLILEEGELPPEGRNFVRLYVSDLRSADVVDLKNNLKSRCPEAQITYHEKEAKEDKETQEEKMKKFNIADGDMLERFVSATNTNLEPKTLLNVAKELCSENT